MTRKLSRNKISMSESSQSKLNYLFFVVGCAINQPQTFSKPVRWRTICFFGFVGVRSTINQFTVVDSTYEVLENSNKRKTTLADFTEDDAHDLCLIRSHTSLFHVGGNYGKKVVHYQRNRAKKIPTRKKLLIINFLRDLESEDFLFKKLPKCDLTQHVFDSTPISNLYDDDFYFS